MPDTLDDPHAMRNLKKGDSPGAISGMDFLNHYHACSTRFRQGNESHPLRMAEQADTRAMLRAAVQPQDSSPQSLQASAPARKKRVRKPIPVPDSDGKYRL